MTNLLCSKDRSALSNGPGTVQRANRDHAQAALDRAKATLAEQPAIDGPAVEEFAKELAKRLSDGEVEARKAWLSAIVDAIVAEPGKIRVIGRNDNFENSLRSHAAGRGPVRSSDRKWWAGPDSNRHRRCYEQRALTIELPAHPSPRASHRKVEATFRPDAERRAGSPPPGEQGRARLESKGPPGVAGKPCSVHGSWIAPRKPPQAAAACRRSPCSSAAWPWRKVKRPICSVSARVCSSVSASAALVSSTSAAF